MSFNLADWAAKHRVSLDALGELYAAFGYIPELANGVVEGDAENLVQAKVRLVGPLHGFSLYRNNVGATKAKCPSCGTPSQPVRYGLANDSAALNKIVKSSDLIGWHSETWLHPETFQPTKVARFVAIECKRADWPGYNPEDPHERAQQRWLELVVSSGGIGRFSTGALPE